MIEHVRGLVAERGQDWLVLDLGAVAVRVNATTSTVSSVGDKGSVATLLTYLYMRDDLLVLYGFGTAAERALFERLIAISGIGPRVAQQILSALSADALHDAIEHEQVDVLVRVPGVGRKTAQRVILELKGKLTPLDGSQAATPTGLVATAPNDAELIGVLVGLGYSAAEAADALRHVSTEERLSDEDRLRAALRRFSTP